MFSNAMQLAADLPGRVLVDDAEAFEEFNLRPSPEAMREIEQLEAASLAAEQRLGTFRVG